MPRRSWPTRSAGAVVFGAVLLLVSCSPSAPQKPDDDLRSDIPLKTAKYLMKHPQEQAELIAVCDLWKGSQQPPMSWPAVVVQNCNNSDTARVLLINQRDREKLKREMGI